MNSKEQIEKTLSGLKDFQLKTVNYVFKQLYVNGRSKMLIADEVGLGKTIVAKGIIAKAFEQFVPTTAKKVFNVIYICSNQALAKQNLKKLNFSGDNLAIDYSDTDDRITGLAYSSKKEENNFSFKIKAFTPSTSFDDKTHAGKVDERVLLFRLLNEYSDINPDKLRWILIATKQIRIETWNSKIDQSKRYDNKKFDKENNWVRPIRPKVRAAFKKILEQVVEVEELKKTYYAADTNSPVKLWTLIKKLCALRLQQNKDFYFNFSKELVSKLRFELSKCCIEFLQADIFILDEFQRYKKLIDSAGDAENEGKISPAIELAREIFSFENSKILMLSATPYKPYTNDFNELNGEVHYNEFITVLKFLMADKSEKFWIQHEFDRKAMFNYLRYPDTLETKMPEAIDLKNQLEKLYRESIVRTEKLLVSKDRDALIKLMDKPISIEPEDISDFVILDQITLLLNEVHHTSLPVPIEYVKSSPFALSFLDNYQHKEKIRKLITSDKQLQQLVSKTKHGWVNLSDIKLYKPLIPPRGKSMPNAKLRLLLEETVHNNGWKYLWIPPSIPYYELDGAYKDSWGYSKSLLFSSWKLVPRMVSSLVSYEAERLCIGNPKSISERERKENEKPNYFQKRRSPRPQFTFKVLKEEQEPQQMNNFMLSYPCLFLADLYDPAINVLEKKSIKQIRDILKDALILAFNKYELNNYVTGDGDWQKWYWLAPLLFDKVTENQRIMSQWFSKGVPPSELAIDTENLNDDKEESVGRKAHFQLAGTVFLDSKKMSAAKLSNDQLDLVCEHLADLTIGSPAICYLRSQQRHMDFSIALLDASYNVSSAFLSMFNKPESIAIVRLHTIDGFYWTQVLKYLIDGNVQAMLDEFVFLLISGENIQDTSELSDFISDILSVRTATSDIEDYQTFIENLTNQKKQRKAIRSHYAVDFGTQKINTAQGAGRQINIRQAFNSPFRPFVLASTSIGQEGLDFHLYCKKIFHWNLPSNPIDFEQREGRIHRYQGLVIRLNLASKYKDELYFQNKRNDVWEALFKYAESEKAKSKFPCDLIPFWHTETINDIKIERFVPLYPFSKDIEKFDNLIKILTFYRLTFGQPRQEELVEALHDSGFSDEEIRKLDDLIINLSPIRFS